MERQQKGYDISKPAFAEMLKEIVDNDHKTAEQGQGSDYVAVTPIVFWTQLFAKYFLHSLCQSHDDLLFYVKKQEGHSDEVIVHRQESATSPGLGDPEIDWHETVFLNMVLHQLDYTLYMAICSKEDDDAPLIIHKKKSMKVYPSPSHHQMKEKGESTKLTYPNIFFTVENFEEEWSEMNLQKNQKVCIEMISTDKARVSFSCVLFFGAIDHYKVSEVYSEKTSSKMNDWMNKWSFGLYKTQSEPIFIHMKGPNGSGYAEMALQSLPDSNSRTSSKSDSATSLRSQLTYLSLPWQDIVLKLMQQFEKPEVARSPILAEYGE